MGSSRDGRHQKATSRSVMPLAVIAASFFLPTVRTCSVIESPAEVAAKGLVWVVPWYLAALVLAGITGVAIIKLRAPEKPGWWAGGAAVVACGLVALSGLVLFVAQVGERAEDPVLWFALGISAVSVGLGIVSLGRARAEADWSAWTWLLLAYWSFALPLLALIMIPLLDGDFDDLGLGAYFVALAMATLGFVLGRAVRR